MENNLRKEKDHDKNVEHQKELNDLENVSPTHKGGFEKNHPKPEDIKNKKNC